MVARQFSVEVAQGISRRTLGMALATCRRQVRQDELIDAFEAEQRGQLERAYSRLSAAGFGCEAWLIRWPPGSVAPLHDHGRARGVAQVVAGTLNELRFVPGSAVPQLRDWRPGESIDLARGICHEVRNLAGHTAYSIHVYAPRLERMTFYDRGACGELRPVRQERSIEWQNAARGFG
jgi:predicted metal-dependent enzyme (double-stranded beta helix superfamily)